VTGNGVELDVDVTVETPQAAGDYRLFVALIEEYIHYSGGGEADSSALIQVLEQLNGAGK
jgi:hypothetical protein